MVAPANAPATHEAELPEPEERFVPVQSEDEELISHQSLTSCGIEKENV